MPTVHVLSATGMSYRVPSIILSHPSRAGANTCQIQTSLPVLCCLSSATLPATQLLPGADTRAIRIQEGCEEQRLWGRQGSSPGKVQEPARRAVQRGALAAAVCLGPAPASPVVCFLHDRSQLTRV